MKETRVKERKGYIKFIYIFCIFALIINTLFLGAFFILEKPAQAGEPEVSGDVKTSLTVGSTTTMPPVVKATWAMKGRSFGKDNYIGYIGGEGIDDDITAEGAQFFAPGEWNKNMHYTVCAIVTDPNGVGDIDGVYADIYYPKNRPMHTSPSDPVHADYDPDEIDDPSGGCGAFIEENTLKKLSKNDGIRLFCDNIRTNNIFLPLFNKDGYFTNLSITSIEEMYDEICDPNIGELWEEEAYVYCDDKILTWEDPAGYYRIKASGHDTNGPGDILENSFKYIEYTGFEIDFSSIQYKGVIKGVRNQVSGDRDFNTNMPTIRNIGNTRLNVLIAQDDMGFGFRDGNIWNVNYDARVGNKLSDWHDLYAPFKLVADDNNPLAQNYYKLSEILDLSETEKLDFVILVNKWSKGVNYQYGGAMWLDADKAEFKGCGQDI